MRMQIPRTPTTGRCGRTDCNPLHALPVTAFMLICLWSMTTVPLHAASTQVRQASGNAANSTTVVRIVPMEVISGNEVTLSVLLEAQGVENAAGFSFAFDLSYLTYQSALRGSGLPPNAAFVRNENETPNGKLGILIGLDFMETFAPGTYEIARLTFLASDMLTGTTLVSFGDVPIPRSFSTADAQDISDVLYLPGTVTLVSPEEGEPPAEGEPSLEGEAAAEGESEPLSIQLLCGTLEYKNSGLPLTLRVTTHGGQGTITYQWYRIHTDETYTPIADAIDSSLFFPELAPEDAGHYFCRAMDELSIVDSDHIELVVHTQLPPGPMSSMMVAILLCLGAISFLKSNQHLHTHTRCQVIFGKERNTP